MKQDFMILATLPTPHRYPKQLFKMSFSSLVSPTHNKLSSDVFGSFSF